MPTPTDNTTQLAKTPTSVLRNKPKGSLQKRNFDTLVSQKGYPVVIEKALVCPCASVGSQALPECRNCGGSGWLWYNPVSTKAVVQSMNKDTKFKDWSKEDIGTASITTYQEVELGYMDKIRLTEGLTSYTEVVRPEIYDDGTMRARLRYRPISVEAIFRFDTVTTALVSLTLPTDGSIGGNILTLDPSLNGITNLTITIRYQHNPVFVVLDLPRSIISSESLHHTTKKEDHYSFPVHAVARTMHYVINETSIDEAYLFDNSFTPTCSETVGLTLNGQTITINSYTQAEIDGLTPTVALIVFNSTKGVFEGWTGSEWDTLTSEWATEQW